MNAAVGREGWVIAGAVVGYALILAGNPVRASLRDGLRCLRRYPRVWILPAGFALAHAGFHFGVHVHETWTIPGAGPLVGAASGWQPPSWRQVAADCWLPTAESSAAIFNCIVTTFPLSALWAALFLVNWRSSHTALARGLRRRFGRWRGTAIQLGLVCCAAAAIVKPFLFVGLQRLNLYIGAAALEPMGEIVDGLSFLFEYLLGVSVQIYLVLLCYAWLRGLTFDFESLRRFALRRFVFVVKWALVVMVVSSLGIHLPLVVATFLPPDRRFDAGQMILVTRTLLAGTLLVFCGLQALLVFHNESLRRALADQLALWRRYGWHLAWLLVIVALHFLLLEAADALFAPAMAAWTWPGLVWRLLVHPVLWSLLAGWLLVSWVCLFQRCERDRPELEELVRY